MKKISVPKDKCPLDVLAEMGEQTKNAWIFLHQNAINKLRRTVNKVTKLRDLCEFAWDATEKYTSTILTFKKETGCWYKVCRIYASDIAFRLQVKDPENVIFLKMDEE